MKTKLAVLMLCCMFTLTAFAQDVPIPYFIEAKVHPNGSHTYQHVELMTEGQHAWKDKDTDAVMSLLPRPSVNKNPEGKFSIRFTLLGTFPKVLGDASELNTIQVKTGHTVYSIEFDPLAMPSEPEPSIYYGMSRIGDVQYVIGLAINEANRVLVTFLEEDAIRLIEMIAYQTGEEIVTIRFDTNEGNLNLNTPLSISNPLREFY